MRIWVDGVKVKGPFALGHSFCTPSVPNVGKTQVVMRSSIVVVERYSSACRLQNSFLGRFGSV